MSVLVVAGSKISTPNRGAPWYAAASARFFSTDRVRVGGATFIDTHRARVPGDRRPPAVDALGQRVVGSLLGDQAVADAGVGAGRVGAAHQPPAGGRPQRPAGRASRPGTGRRTRGPPGRPHRPGRRTRRSAWPGTRARRSPRAAASAHDQRVDGGRRGRWPRRRRRRSCPAPGDLPPRPASRPPPGRRRSGRVRRAARGPRRRLRRGWPGSWLATGTSSVPALRRATSRTRSQICGTGRSTPSPGRPSPAARAAGRLQRRRRAPRSSGRAGPATPGAPRPSRWRPRRMAR